MYRVVFKNETCDKNDRAEHMNAARQVGDRQGLVGGGTQREDDALLSSVDRVVDEVRNGLREHQQDDGHWVFELEADATIPAEYVLLEHFLDEIDWSVEEKIGVYLRERQGEHGGWPLFYGGEFNISASVKAYFALKLTGDDVNEPHMKHAREAILAHGGAAKCNVFTRITLALFGNSRRPALGPDIPHGIAQFAVPPANLTLSLNQSVCERGRAIAKCG